MRSGRNRRARLGGGRAADRLGPYLGQLVSGLNDERRERIRSEERAAIAAHLHDSVLQTLALMQRAAADPRRMVMLARRQERELRSWFYDVTAAAPRRVRWRTCEGIAAEVELDHGLPVDLVVVGDVPLDGRRRGLGRRVREAAANAAKHAGRDRVSIYIEVEPDTVTAFVRDKGVGFVPAVTADRRGIAMSIVGRIERVGGTGRARFLAGGGTEWELLVPSRTDPAR